MKHYDNHDIENSLYEEGFELIAGTDEVGRGPLAGPVVACAVIMPKSLEIEGVTDSKKVSLKNRLLLNEIIKEKALAYSIVFIDEKTIDEINILEASRLAMYKAVTSLKITPDYLLTDAMELNIDIPYSKLIKGDEKSFTIGCASILAKVARDNYMDELHNKYPEYDFIHNKGYGTKKHLNALKVYGVSTVHRRCYSPVQKEIEQGNIRK